MLIDDAIKDYKERIGPGFTWPTHGEVERGGFIVLYHRRTELARYQVTHAGLRWAWLAYVRPDWRVVVHPQPRRG